VIFPVIFLTRFTAVENLGATAGITAGFATNVAVIIHHLCKVEVSTDSQILNN